MGHNQWGEQHVDEGQVVDDVVLEVNERVVDKLQGGRTYSDPEGCRHDPDVHQEIAGEVEDRGHPDLSEEPKDGQGGPEDRGLRERQQCNRDLQAPT